MGHVALSAYVRQKDLPSPLRVAVRISFPNGGPYEATVGNPAGDALLRFTSGNDTR